MSLACLLLWMYQFPHRRSKAKYVKISITLKNIKLLLCQPSLLACLLHWIDQLTGSLLQTSTDLMKIRITLKNIKPLLCQPSLLACLLHWIDQLTGLLLQTSTDLMKISISLKNFQPLLCRPCPLACLLQFTCGCYRQLKSGHLVISPTSTQRARRCVWREDKHWRTCCQ